MFFYAYVLLNLESKTFYTGYTKNLLKRIDEHKNKKVFATKSYKSFRLIYYEASLSKYDALKRERYLKSGPGKKYLKNRLKSYLKQ